MDDKKTYLYNLEEKLNYYKEQLSTGGQAGNSLSASLKDILETAEDTYMKLQSSAEEEWEDLKNKADQSFQALQGAFEKAFGSSWKDLKNCMEGAEKHTQEFLETAEEYIQNNPLKSLFFAVGLGYFLRKILK